MKYRMSFSTGGLFLRESILLAEMYLETQEWKLVRQRATDENLVQARTVSSTNRISGEIIGRLTSLYAEELDLLVNGAENEQKYVAWLSICRRYTFVGEFATECLRESHLLLKQSLANDDFDVFFARKADWQPELENLKTSTRKRLRQVLFKMLREAKLLDDSGHIIPALITSRFQAALQNPAQDLSFFPVANSSMRGTP